LPPEVDDRQKNNMGKTEITIVPFYFIKNNNRKYLLNFLIFLPNKSISFSSMRRLTSPLALSIVQTAISKEEKCLVGEVLPI
jgi:hypothetical protein